MPNESAEVSNGSLANVVITVAGTSLPKPAPRTITIDQQGCRYHPHVQAVSTGSTLEILNSDPMLHNIHGRMGTQTLFNLAMPLKGQRIPEAAADGRPGGHQVRRPQLDAGVRDP